MDEIVIVNGARTAMAEYEGTPGGGLFKDLTAQELGAAAAKEAMRRAKIDPAQIDQVIMGNALQTSNDAIYGARHVGLKAGVPEKSPGLTVNRLCGSGIQSLINGAHTLLLKETNYVLAGGMENMSQAPHVIHGARSGFKLGQGKLDDLLMAALYDPIPQLFMAQTAEKLARKYEISRQAQDDYALRSHRLGTAAVNEGRFAAEITPVVVKAGRKEITVDRDDHIKPDTNAEALAKLHPAFGKDGTVTAGNASGIVDGAACLVLTTAARAKADGLSPLGKIKSWAVVGVDPSIMGIGPCPAIRLALENANLRLGDVNLFEINEAFAAQYLAVEKELGLNRDKVNVNGGAIALGHPLGASGTRLVLTLLMELRRRKQALGVASACIGGGMGIAMVVEAL